MMFLQLARVENCPTDKGAANEVAGNTCLWSYHASSVDAFKAVGVQILHFDWTAPCPIGSGRGKEVKSSTLKQRKHKNICFTSLDKVHTCHGNNIFFSKHTDQSAAA